MRQVQREHVARGVPAERDLAGPGRLGHEDRHPGQYPLEGALERLDPHVDLRLLPQHHVVLEEDRQLAVEGQVQHRDELALDPVRQAGAGAVGDLPGQEHGSRGHWEIVPVRVTPGGSAGSQPCVPGWPRAPSPPRRVDRRSRPAVAGRVRVHLEFRSGEPGHGRPVQRHRGRRRVGDDHRPRRRDTDRADRRYPRVPVRRPRPERGRRAGGRRHRLAGHAAAARGRERRAGLGLRRRRWRRVEHPRPRGRAEADRRRGGDGVRGRPQGRDGDRRSRGTRRSARPDRRRLRPVRHPRGHLPGAGRLGTARDRQPVLGPGRPRRRPTGPGPGGLQPGEVHGGRVDPAGADRRCRPARRPGLGTGDRLAVEPAVQRRRGRTGAGPGQWQPADRPRRRRQRRARGAGGRRYRRGDDRGHLGARADRRHRRDRRPARRARRTGAGRAGRRTGSQLRRDGRQRRRPADHLGARWRGVPGPADPGHRPVPRRAGRPDAPPRDERGGAPVGTGGPRRGDRTGGGGGPGRWAGRRVAGPGRQGGTRPGDPGRARA